MPEIISDYFILTFQEPHAAQVRVIDFLTAVRKHGKLMKEESTIKKKSTARKSSLSTINSPEAYSVRIEDFLLLLKKSNEATKSARAMKRSNGREVRVKGTDYFKHFVTVLRQLTKLAGSVHAFIENAATGLHVVGADIGRKVLTNLPAYRTGSDEMRRQVSSNVDEHSKLMAQSVDSEQIEMIEVDDVLHLAMSLWLDERSRAKSLLEKMFVDGDDNDDGYLTLEEFRALISNVDPKRSGVEVTHMYREALTLTSMNASAVNGVKKGSPSATTGGGITPDVFAIVGIRHGLLVHPDITISDAEDNEEENDERDTSARKEKEPVVATQFTSAMSQEESDALVFDAMASTFQKQRSSVLKAVIGHENKRSVFDKFEKLLMARVDLGSCMATFGELEMLLAE
jgi:hypothetical protein